MTKGNICVRANERTEVDSLARGYCKIGTLVWEVGTLRLYTVRLGYIGTNGLKTPVESPTLDTR